MRKWILACVVAGFVGAAIFYSPYLGIDGQTRYVCPVCPHISGMNGGPVLRYMRFTLISGTLNAALFSMAGAAALTLFKRLRKMISQREAKSP